MCHKKALVTVCVSGEEWDSSWEDDLIQDDATSKTSDVEDGDYGD